MTKNFNFKVHGEYIELVKQFKYLVTTFTCPLSFTEYLKLEIGMQELKVQGILKGLG